jgi:peptidoglycan/LPS O-acetylase OafA/YrhL
LSTGVQTLKLSYFTTGRDNNFNLIRIIAAYAVLVTHSFAIAIGTGSAEPFRETLGMTIGSIAVDIFFVTSGFLVTASLLRRQSTIEFIWARALRIYPALFVMLFLTVAGLGPFFTTVALSSYITDWMTYEYFLKCFTLFAGVSYTLPGVFESNPLKDLVNHSLWTLPRELKMYAILGFTWLLLCVIPKYRVKIFRITIVISAFMVGFLLILSQLGITGVDSRFFRLYFMFFTGSAFYILKERIILSHVVFYAFLAALLLSMLNKHVFIITYQATIAYLLFFVAYVPSGVIRKYNKLGDYSYGVYIYAFPVQQSVAALIPGVSVLSMMIISSLVTLIFSVLSWHFIEKHALKLKGQYADYTRKILAKSLSG